MTGNSTNVNLDRALPTGVTLCIPSSDLRVDNDHLSRSLPSVDHVHLFLHCLLIMLLVVCGPLVEPAVQRQLIFLPVEVDTGHSVPVSAADGSGGLILSRLLLLILVQCHKAEEALYVLCGQEAGVDGCRALEEGLFTRAVLGPVVLLQVTQRRGAALHAQHQEHSHRGSCHQQPAYQLQKMREC